MDVKSTFKLSNGDVLEVRSEPVEVIGGWIGAEPEVPRRFIPGPRDYFLNGEPISEEHAQTVLAADTP